MGITRAWGSAVAAAMLASGVLLSGCASAAPSADPVAESSPTPDPSPTVEPCTFASEAAVAVVNASIAAEPGFQQSGVEPYPQVLDQLVAERYEPLDIWTLTGVFAASGSEGGYFAEWATREDPNAQDFDGELFSFPFTASADESAAPELVPGYVGEHDMDLVPPSPNGCQEMLGD